MAAVSSIGSAIELLENDEWKKVSLMLIFLRYTYELCTNVIFPCLKFLMIEVMTCTGELGMTNE